MAVIVDDNATLKSHFTIFLHLVDTWVKSWFRIIFIVEYAEIYNFVFRFNTTRKMNMLKMQWKHPVPT